MKIDHIASSIKNERPNLKALANRIWRSWALLYVAKFRHQNRPARNNSGNVSGMVNWFPSVDIFTYWIKLLQRRMRLNWVLPVKNWAPNVNWIKSSLHRDLYAALKQPSNKAILLGKPRRLKIVKSGGNEKRPLVSYALCCGERGSSRFFKIKYLLSIWQSLVG